jgi:demethylmacrocin O-methyltransferase
MSRPNAELAAIVSIADGTLQETRERLGQIDCSSLARDLMIELSERTKNFEAPERTTKVQIELSTPEGELYPFVLAVGPDDPLVEARRLEDAPVRIFQDLAEMLRGVYGAGTARNDATRRVWIFDEPGPATDDPDDPWRTSARAATAAAGQVLDAISLDNVKLSTLARRFGTDKWGIHFYTSPYEAHLKEYREQRVNLLEIGVGGYDNPDQGGESLRMWRAYFRRGLIYGLDLHDKSLLDSPRIETLRGDQGDPQALTEIASEIGPLDIVIDDGSHLSDHVIASFTALFPRLTSGGIYVIEDLQTAYWPGWNGGRTDPNDPRTTTGFLKTLIDALHHQDRLTTSSAAPMEIERHIRAIHLYHNIVFIEKGLNDEQGAPSWIRRDSTAASTA